MPCSIQDAVVQWSLKVRNTLHTHTRDERHDSITQWMWTATPSTLQEAAIQSLTWLCWSIVTRAKESHKGTNVAFSNALLEINTTTGEKLPASLHRLNTIAENLQRFKDQSNRSDTSVALTQWETERLIESCLSALTTANSDKFVAISSMSELIERKVDSSVWFKVYQECSQFRFIVSAKQVKPTHNSVLDKGQIPDDPFSSTFGVFDTNAPASKPATSVFTDLLF